MAESFIKTASTDLNIDALLQNVKYFRVTNLKQLKTIHEHLESLIKKDVSCRLVVIDSIAFHFRSNGTDMAQRTRDLHLLSLNLRRFASNYHVAVVVTNQMTTKIISSRSVVVPALGIVKFNL